MLTGRERECEQLDELLDRARLGRSGTLVVRGEAGVGKTALLDYAAERAGDMTVTRALGVESEVELEHAGLLDVCRPLVGVLDELPESQATALRAAFGHGPARALDRFAVGAATLGLIATAADERPVLVLVDDAQWMDPASVDALLFAARRLDADGAVVLFAARDDDQRPFGAHGIPELRLDGLDVDAAGVLLREHGVAEPSVVSRLHEATRGNPLALVELLGHLSEAQLRGDEALGDPLPPGSSVERAFARRADALPAEARKALLVCAVSSTADSHLVVRALDALGLVATALEPAEDSGLVAIRDGRIAFRHPLVRSAVYHTARPSERRAIHRALADAAGAERPEERAWHLAAAALGPDEQVAAALEEAATQARSRSGFAAAATALERSARLTPEHEVRSRRLAAAADAAWEAGRGDAAARLVEEALSLTTERTVRARALRLRGAVEYFAGDAAAAADALLEAAALLEDDDPAGSVGARADAVMALIRTRERDRALETARTARALAAEDGSETDFEATATLGYALCFTGRFGEAEPYLRRAVELMSASTSIPTPLRAVRLSATLAWLGRYEDGRRYMSSLVDRARTAGAVGSLPYLLAGAAWQALHASHWAEAEADAGEALELAEQLGQPVTAIQAQGVLTWVHSLRGDRARAVEHGDATRAHAGQYGYALYGLLVAACYGVLHLGAGDVESAIVELEQIAHYTEERKLRIPGVAPQLELAEAYVRAGRSADAEEIVAAFERSELAADPYLAAVAARCRGILASEEEFGPHFGRALALHESIPSPFARARTELCYGERLRRAGHRRDAREQLRAALSTFEGLGAAAWAERARSELRASGETLQRRDETTGDRLTPQELQIALQVAQGKTNKEVGAALFLSHKTVEFHLSRIYRKLDIASRAELIKRFAEAGEAALEPVG